LASRKEEVCHVDLSLKVLFCDQLPILIDEIKLGNPVISAYVLYGIINKARIHINGIVYRKLVFGLDQKIENGQEENREQQQKQQRRSRLLEKIN
jgi:hypothetical protein